MTQIKNIHKNGYIHFDIRSSNIFYRGHENNYEYTISDFGWLRPINEVKGNWLQLNIVANYYHLNVSSWGMNFILEIKNFYTNRNYDLDKMNDNCKKIMQSPELADYAFMVKLIRERRKWHQNLTIKSVKLLEDTLRQYIPEMINAGYLE